MSVETFQLFESDVKSGSAPLARGYTFCRDLAYSFLCVPDVFVRATARSA